MTSMKEPHGLHFKNGLEVKENEAKNFLKKTIIRVCLYSIIASFIDFTVAASFYGAMGGKFGEK